MATTKVRFSGIIVFFCTAANSRFPPVVTFPISKTAVAQIQKSTAKPYTCWHPISGWDRVIEGRAGWPFSPSRGPAIPPSEPCPKSTAAGPPRTRPGPNRGIFRTKVTVRNQNGKDVMTLVSTGQVLARGEG